MATKLQPPPFKTPFVNEDGLITAQWANWINLLFTRVGGAEASSISEIDETLTDHESRIDALEP